MSTKLASSYLKIKEFCQDYDFGIGPQGNGYRTFLTIIDCFNEQANHGTIVTAEEIPIYQNVLEQIADLLLQLNQEGAKPDHAITDTDVTTYAKIYDLKQQIHEKLSGPMKAFWYGEKTLKIISTLGAINDALKSEDSLKILGDKSLKVAVSTGLADIKTFPIPRINKWIIEVSSGIAQLIQTEARTDDTVDCLIIRPKNMQHEDKFLVYTHGGGFYAFNPYVYSFLLTIWSNAIGVPIVAPFYRKSPTHKYPAGLQDCLDTYVFFTSEAPEVKDLLGLSPRKSYLVGDSAGGNLAMGTTFALEMIRRSGGDVVLPSGINVHYPYPRPGPIVAPSNVFEAIDPIITAENMANTISKYASTSPLLTDDWFKEPDSKQSMLLFQKFMKDPLYNNLSWTDWDSLKNIPLIVMVCDFDPLMDSGLELAKKWKGKVRVTRAERQVHSFALLVVKSSPDDLKILEHDLNDLVTDVV